MVKLVKKRHSLSSATNDSTRFPQRPTPGLLSDVSGIVIVGGNGYSWSSATNGIYGIRLDFDMTWLGPSLAYRRVYGFQLRCLSE
ncbi:hypothetical protein [uncultured Rikenella sp.]|uniref:hypothetical protein n=1 Tax=uncultured Rikenella sp. TaxID=368003 RepID=UPI00260ABAC4|nr:hypothetical protein [uncultured Rikenella sp.]